MYDGLLVIDADAHKMENPVVFLDYLDAAFRHRIRSRTDRWGQPRMVVMDRNPRTGRPDRPQFLLSRRGRSWIEMMARRAASRSIPAGA